MNKARPAVLPIWVMAAFVTAMSFAWTYVVANRGMFAFDQSQVFDGGWRILSGQVPYRDFLMAFGPLTFVLQAISFRIFGVNWAAMAAASAILGALAGLIAMRIAAQLFGRERRGLWLASGILVGLSFQAIFGTMMMEQVGFFFCLLGLLAVCEGTKSIGWRRYLHLGTAGTCIVLAFLGKQNVGALSFLLLAATTLVAAPPKIGAQCKSLGAILAGATLAAGVFALWLWHYSDPSLFWRHAIQVPAEVGGGRLWTRSHFYIPYLLTSIQGSTQWAYALALGVASWSVYRLYSSQETREEWKREAGLRLALLLTVALPTVQSLFVVSTMNQAQNTLFLSALTLTIAAGLFGRQPFTRDTAAWLRILVGVVSACLFIEIVYHAWFRTMQDASPQGATLSRSLTIPSLSSLRWMAPTYARYSSSDDKSVRGPEIRPGDLESVYEYLTVHRQPFFVVGDAAFLYGAVGARSQGPLLYIQNNHYYRSSDLPALDDWTLEDLKRNRVTIVVREARQFERSKYPLDKTLNWIAENFEPGRSFGHFEILVRKSQ